MKRRLSDYIADVLVEHGIQNVFTVTGGGAMYLNDSFGHHPGLSCLYTHHEQAAAMAAEAYAREDNTPAAVCVTTGPGATNAITGVVCGWMDSIPMLILSGQARYATTVYASGLNLRTRGVQEFDIIGSVRNMTKYCKLITDPQDIRFELEKAIFLAKEGRPGPCWLDIPLDVQGAMIETTGLRGFIPDYTAPQRTFARDEGKKLLDRITSAERPVLFAGNGVRLAGAHSELLKLADQLRIPVVTGMSSVDAIASDHPYYIGRSGGTGDRAGNFAIQNADVLFSIGSRLSFFQTGFNHRTWARGAYKIINDIDEQELEKDSIHADWKICCDAKNLILVLLELLPEPLPEKTEWVQQCVLWKEKYPVVQQKHREDQQPNIYAFYDAMTRKLGPEDRLVVSVGTSRVAGSQASRITEGMRFITNPSTAAMGYGLPAAIGTCIANKGRKTCLVTGEGSFQMNIQELQTIVQNRLHIVIFIMNNQGYHSIRMTQRSYFGGKLVGVGPESGDLSFPDLSRLIPAYGIPYRRCEKMTEMESAIQWALQAEGPCVCEMMLSTRQVTEPKAASRKLPDGTMISAPLEDMAPFLPEDEIRRNMYIPLIEKFSDA